MIKLANEQIVYLKNPKHFLKMKMSHLRTKAKAAVIRRFGGLGVLQVEEIAIPVPGQGQFSIEVDAASVNHLDYKIRTGKGNPNPRIHVLRNNVIMLNFGGGCIHGA
jgi:uncharacterized membrane protein